MQKHLISVSLQKFISGKVKDGYFNVSFMLIVCIGFTFLMAVNSKTLVHFAVGATLILILSVYFIYANIFLKGNHINQTVEEIVLGDKIVLKTFPYNFLFIKKEPVLIELPYDEIKLYLVDYPFKKYTDVIKHDCWAINNVAYKTYIIPEHFDPEVQDWIKSIPKV